MSKTNLQVRTGNRVIVSIDGHEVGLMQNINGSDDYGLDKASGIGDIHTIEHVPTNANHSISCSQLVLFKGALRDLGIATENGDGALKGIVFDIVVQSKDDGSVLRKWMGCSYGGGSVDVNKHAIIVANASFMALDVAGTGF